jgi:hypothetical protein
MQCRYCGKELALLKRLTGGGEFCSEAHKQSYQDEYNKLALGRLLQAQKHPKSEAAAKQSDPPAKKPTTPSAAPVAVEEPVVEEIAVEQTLEMPVLESTTLELSNLEAAVAEEEPEPEAPVEVEAEPLEMAEFLLDSPLAAGPAEETPYLESWLEISSGPAVADRQLPANGDFSLATGELLSLDLGPLASPAVLIAEAPVAAVNPAPQEFTNGRGPDRPSVLWKGTTANHLPAAGPISISASPSGMEFAPDSKLDTGQVGESDFATAIVVADSNLLDLPFTTIEFPAEDAGVALSVSLARQPEQPEAEVDSASGEDDSPRGSLEALAKLHQDLIEEQGLLDAQAPLEPEVVTPEVTPEAESLALVPQLAAPAAMDVVDAISIVPEIVEPAAVQTVQSTGEPIPGRATELLDVAIRMFPPGKAAPMAGPALPTQTDPLLPNLKGLPLRPKVAVATGYVPPSAAAPASPKAAANPKTAPVPAAAAQSATKEAHAPAKTAQPAAKQAARINQPKQPGAPVKTPAPTAAKPVPKVQAPTPAAVKTATPGPAKHEPEIPKADAAAASSSSAKAGVPAAEPAAEAPVKLAAKPAPKPAASDEGAKESAKTPVKAAKPPIEKPGDESVPNFGAMQQPSASFAGSLKVKLGIAIVFLVVACSTWLGWGGKSKPAPSNSSISADGAGPSIIMGEGGWVEGWAGDPTGLHDGRQITIYRPSLKLTDYRIEFQGSIETQSIGWVFRAANPENYYAYKLVASAGLSRKVELFKYLVINGRQTQVGRVPIDLTVPPDAVFNIRTDIRGPQFSTYIQGRQVDVWTDDQLKAGGVGFLNERDERGKVKSVSIRYLNGAAK